MRALFVLGALVLSMPVGAVHPDIYELYRCQGQDRFEYWTTVPCAPGDQRIARDSNVDARKPLAEQIRGAECRYQVRKDFGKQRLPEGTADRVPSIAHCQ